MLGAYKLVDNVCVTPVLQMLFLGNVFLNNCQYLKPLSAKAVLPLWKTRAVVQPHQKHQKIFPAQVQEEMLQYRSCMGLQKLVEVGTVSCVFFPFCAKFKRKCWSISVCCGRKLTINSSGALMQCSCCTALSNLL